MMKQIVARGEPIPAALLAPLLDSSQLLREADPTRLQQRFHEQGYLFVKQFFDRDDILAARQEILQRLVEVGEIAEPALEGIFTGLSQRREQVADLGKFWKSVSETWSLRRLSHSAALHDLMHTLLGGAAQAQDYLFLRPATPGKSTRIHCDYPFFTRATEAVATAWIALGEVPTELGPLFVLEGSHQWPDVIEGHRGFDVAVDTKRKASWEETPQEIACQRRTRLLTADFAAGDLVVFGMFLLHGALDNVSMENRVRLSCDVRYQLASAVRDPRYFGAHPSGTTGIGYGELIGAKPLTDEWHIR